MAEKELKSVIIQFRAAPTERDQLRKLAKEQNFLSLTELIRYVLRRELEKHQTSGSYAQ